MPLAVQLPQIILVCGAIGNTILAMEGQTHENKNWFGQAGKSRSASGSGEPT
jgi:hypothetical protein